MNVKCEDFTKLKNRVDTLEKRLEKSEKKIKLYEAMEKEKWMRKKRKEYEWAKRTFEDLVTALDGDEIRAWEIIGSCLSQYERDNGWVK